MDLFDDLSKDTKKVSKKTDKRTIEVDDLTFFEDVQKYQELQKRMAKDKEEADEINERLKKLAKDKWVELYTEEKSNPGSVIIEQNVLDDISRLMLVPTEKYVTLNQKNVGKYMSKYGNDVIESNTVYSFNNDIIVKYSKIITKLIKECDEIDNDDKKNLIQASTTFNIKKGTIDKLTDFKDTNISEVIEDLKPVFQLKNVEIILS